jgi:hypothetical protein
MTEKKHPESKAARSMHEGITECDDPICCCEPEPRWRALAEELEREEAARRATKRPDAPKGRSLAKKPSR